MENELSAGRKTLYYAIVIVCVFLILYILYQQIYRIVVPSQYYVELHISKTFWYALSNSQILRLLTRIFRIVGIVALFAFWVKPKRKWQFILLIFAMLLPTLKSEGMSLLYNNPSIWKHTTLLNIIGISLIVIGLLIQWTMIIMLTRKSNRDAKPILIAHIVLFAIGLVSLVLFNFGGLILRQSSFEAVIRVLTWLSTAAGIAIYIMTIIYLKRKLGAQMPFTNSYRFAKKECTNHPPEDD